MDFAPTGVAQIEAVRGAMGDRMGIVVDANQGWRVALVEDAALWTLERATGLAHARAGLGVGWIEEPLDMYAFGEQAELRRGSEVPIAGGVLNGGWFEYKVMLEKGSYDVCQADATVGEVLATRCGCSMPAANEGWAILPTRGLAAWAFSSTSTSSRLDRGTIH